MIVFGSPGARTVPDGFPQEKAWTQLVDTNVPDHGDSRRLTAGDEYDLAARSLVLLKAT